jgi:hypothetical protein
MEVSFILFPARAAGAGEVDDSGVFSVITALLDPAKARRVYTCRGDDPL